MARLTRDGGFWVCSSPPFGLLLPRVYPHILTLLRQIVLVIRFSVIPSHFSTAVFSTCDVKFWHFAVATFLTLPKQIILVYFGVLLVQQQDDSKIKTIVIVIAFVITLALAGWIWYKMAAVKKTLLEEQAARRADREMNEPNPLRKQDSATEGLLGSQISLVPHAETSAGSQPWPPPREWR
jgi:predicted lysophospholipase L1 biosynthesis ABC-type transport system permease subunit